MPVLVFLIFIFTIKAQQAGLPFEDIPIEEGIPTNVQHILQDRTGYLWFATWSGLYKYDGYSFLSYKRDSDNSNKAFDNKMSVLYEDKDGIIWIGSPFGLDKFDPISEKFSHFTPNPNDTIGNKINEVLAICEDKFGMLWIGTSDGLYTLDKASDKFTSFRYDSTDPGSISHNEFGAIYEDKEGALWFGTQVGLDRFDFRSRKFIHYWIDPANRYRPWYAGSNHRINKIIGDDAGTIWLGTNKGLVEFNLKEETFSTYLFIPEDPINRITSISQDVTTNSLWLATTDGLFSFNKKSKQFTHYNTEGSCVISERSGTLWIGTKIGTKKLNRIKQPFKKYPMNRSAFVIKSGKEGIIWIKTSLSSYMIFDTRNEQFVPSPFGKDSVVFVYNSGGDLLIHAENGDIYILDSIGRTVYYGPFPREFIKAPVSHAWKGYRGYWYGTIAGGVHLLDPRTRILKELTNVKLPIDFIYEDNHGLLWVATQMGKAYCYHQEHDTLIEYISDTKNPLTLSGTEITDIYQDKKGRIWFATNNGLNRFEISTENLIHFTERDGLPSNNVRGILEDDHGYLWITTNKGISKFNPETNHFKNYDPSYGLELTADAFFGKGCKTSNGEMYFGGAGGFTRFHPENIRDNPFIPTIVITTFKKFDKPYPFSSKINLPHDENFVSFEFAALSYISPERNQYAYMMERLDKDWVYAGTRRYASYPNLSPGEYVFRVKGSNNDGVWNEAGTSILIIISPPWWKTTWAYVLYSFLILSIIYTTWKLQLKRIRLGHEYEMTKFESEKLHEVDEMKSKFFANISHEFRTPLTLILGPAKDIIYSTKEIKTKQTAELIRRNAGRLMGLVNQLLDLSKVEAGNIRLEASEQNIIPLLKGLVLSFSSLAERKKITLRFNAIEEKISVFLDKDKIEKIINNLLSNAFKFTPEEGKIDVTVEKMIKEVEIRISDSGKGISADHIDKIFDRFYQVDSSHTREQEGTGIGLALTNELVELHKSKIRVESEVRKGTTFIVSIPLGREHLKPEEIVEVEGDEVSEVVMKETELVLEPENRKEKTSIDALVETALSADKEGKPMLLIVEDNPDVRKYIISHLEKNYMIQEAVAGEDGLE